MESGRDDMIKSEMKNCIYDINRAGTKISSFSSGKIGKYEYLTGEEIQQHKIIHRAEFSYLPHWESI